MKKTICVILCVLTVFASCACVKEVETGATPFPEEDTSNSGFRETVLYLQTDTGFIVPIMKRIPKEEGIAKAALSYLVDTYDNSIAADKLGLKTTVPEGTQFSLRIDDDGCATLDIRNLPTLNNEKEEKALVATIVNTLTEFPTIKSVRLLINGKEEKTLPHGTDISGKLEAFLLNVQEGELAATVGGGANAYTVYFPNDSCTLQIPRTYYAEDKPTFELAMRTLVSNAEVGGVFEGTELISADISSEGKARVDLTNSFYETTQHTDGILDAVYDAMLLTAKSFSEVTALTVCVEGAVYCDEELAVNAPIYPNCFE